MRHRESILSWLLVATGCLAFVLSLTLAAPLVAQEEPAMEEAAPDEGAADEAMADEPAADEDEMPKAKAKPAAKADDLEVEETVVEDPAVSAVLESKPTTPAELLRAINILVDLDRPAQAKPLVDNLIKAKLKLADKAALVQQFNSAVLLKLAHHDELGAQLGPFVDDLLKSAEVYRHDPARLANWAKQLRDPNEQVRAHAVLELLQARQAAVAPLVDVLADPARAKEYQSAEAILVQLGDDAVDPLLGVLESSDATLKTKVVAILGRTGAHRAVASLLVPLLSPKSTPELRAAASEALQRIAGHAPSMAEAQRLLEHAARRPLEQAREANSSAADIVEVWHWNAKRKTSMPIDYDPTGASLAIAARAARELHLLAPANAEYRQLYLIAMLQAAKHRGGLDKPLSTGPGTAYAIAAAQGAEVVDDLLATANAKGFLPAATAAAQILGDIGNVELLTRNGASASPLAAAANSADRRLRFAAVEAIMKLKPIEPFAGSSHVADALGFFASSYGTPRVLIAHPRTDQGQQLAGLAAELGYDSDLATNGRRAFQLATSTPDIEFILIHSRLERPAADELLAQLRRDRRTALLPVGLIAPLDDLERVERFARSSTRAEAFLQPQKLDEMRLFTHDVLARGGRDLPSTEERKRQAAAALDWMIALGEQSNRVFDLRKQEAAVLQALYVRDLTPKAIVVLGQLGSAQSQRALVEMANLATQPLATRQLAVAALADSVARHNLMLTRGEVMQIYRLYNSNAGREPDTHAVLGSLLDVIEDKYVPPGPEQLSSGETVTPEDHE